MLRLRSFGIEKMFELLKDSCLKETINWIDRKPFSNSSTNDFVKSSERDEIVAYLLEVCDREDMALNVDTFALFVQLLDRFLSTFKVRSKYLEVLAVACLYIACKVKEEDEKISITSEFLMDCDCKCSIAELLRMEQMVLSKFEWSVNDITAADFLHIFYALLVNQYQKAETIQDALNKATDSNNNLNRKAWKTITQSIILKSNSKTDGNLYPPGDLDFLESLEAKLKQCLCVSDLTNMFRPHVLAFSLISLQMEKSFETIESNIIKNQLKNMLDSMEQYCKLGFETIDKCKESLKTHLASVENTKNLFDNYFDEYYKWKMKNLKQSPKFISPLSAINIQLDAIKEEDEEQELEEEEVENYEEDYDYENIDIAEESCDLSDYVTKKEDYKLDSTNFPSLSFNNSSNSNFFNKTIENNFKPMFFDQSKFMNISYADILRGRTDNKRKLSENSNIDEEIEYDQN